MLPAFLTLQTGPGLHINDQSRVTTQPRLVLISVPVTVPVAVSVILSSLMCPPSTIKETLRDTDVHWSPLVQVMPCGWPFPQNAFVESTVEKAWISKKKKNFFQELEEGLFVCRGLILNDRVTGDFKGLNSSVGLKLQKKNFLSL